MCHSYGIAERKMNRRSVSGEQNQENEVGNEKVGEGAGIFTC